MTNEGKRRAFSKEFKEQIVQLHASGKPRGKIIKEYELTPSAFNKWVRQHPKPKNKPNKLESKPYEGTGSSTGGGSDKDTSVSGKNDDKK